MDQNKLKYDLAMVYAKTKLEEYLKTDYAETAKSLGVPEWHLEVKELEKAFTRAYSQFNSWGDNHISLSIQNLG